MHGSDDMREISLKVPFCYILSTALFFFVLCPPCVYAGRDDVVVVVTEGTCAVYGNDRKPARDNAIDDSMRKAVEQVVYKYVSEDVVIENADIINEGIYSKSEGYIQDYRILKEKIADGHYRVSVRVTLSARDIKDDLAVAGIITDGSQSEEDVEAVTVEVVVSGIEKYRYFRMLMEALETDIKWVDAVHLRRIEADVAVMDVDMQGNAAGLAKSLTLKKFGNFSLDLTDGNSKVIELNMVKE